MRWVVLVAVVGALLLYPTQWLSKGARLQLAQWLGTQSYRPAPESLANASGEVEAFCPDDLLGWRDAQTIEGVSVRRSATCVADNPHAVAAEQAYKTVRNRGKI